MQPQFCHLHRPRWPSCTTSAALDPNDTRGGEWQPDWGGGYHCSMVLCLLQASFCLLTPFFGLSLILTNQNLSLGLEDGLAGDRGEPPPASCPLTSTHATVPHLHRMLNKPPPLVPIYKLGSTIPCVPSFPDTREATGAREGSHF